MSKKLCKFYWDCGRVGFLDGLFVADPNEIPFAQEIYFGEVLGKHSEIHGRLDKEDITYLDVSEEFAETLMEVAGSKTISGYNPIDYWEGADD